MVETEELNEQAGIVDKPEDAADLIKKYEEILKTKRKGNYMCNVSSRKSLPSVSRERKVCEVGC